MKQERLMQVTTQVHNNSAAMRLAPISERTSNKISALFSFWPFDKLFTSSPVVGVLTLSGIIGKVGMSKGLTLLALNKEIEKAFNIPKAKAVCLIIDSPGGSPVQSELIASRIIELSETKQIPVYSFVHDMAASGGYWLACAGKEIYASESSVIGSIGVKSAGFGFVEAMEKLGVERRIYTQGHNKSVLDPFQPVKEHDVEIILKLQQQVHKHFIEYVKTRRGGKLTQSDDILFNGEFWAGKTAVDYGLIDGIGEMYSMMKTRYGSKVKFIYSTAKESWIKKYLGLALSTDNFARAIISAIRTEIETDTHASKYRLW